MIPDPDLRDPQTSPLTSERVPIDSLELHPRNTRQGDVGAICESLTAHGQYRPIVAQTSTRHVLAGNHTLLAARSLGWNEIDVTWLDVDDDQALRVLLVDNRTNDLASYDDRGLADLLAELAEGPKGLEGTGFDGDALDDLLTDLAGKTAGLVDPDSVPELGEPRTNLGDLWLLGDHRLLCGDATDEAAVRRLLVEAPILMVTDPPYGVELDQGWRDRAGLNNWNGRLAPAQSDHLAGDNRIDWSDAYRLAGADVAFVWHAGLYSGEVAASIVAAGYELRQQIVWIKPAAPISRMHYHARHEPCWYAVRKGGTGHYNGDRTQTTVWEAASPKHIFTNKGLGPEDAKADHPTQKPVAIFEPPIVNHTKLGQWVYDPFGGSGTALIAAEQHGRRAALMELSPRYCDVIVARWEQFTGKQATLA